MKKLLLSLLILVTIQAKAQDTTVVTAVTIKTRTVLLLTPFLQGYDDSVKTVVYLKWRTSLRTNTPTVAATINGTATVLTDSIPTLLVADMYQYLLSQSNNAVTSAVTDFRSAISAKRTANSYLDRLCNDIEDRQTSFYRQLLAAGLNLLIQRRVNF